MNEIVKPFHKRFLNRYPFNNDSSVYSELVSINQFIDFFQPGGTVKQFVSEHLKQFLSDGKEKPLLSNSALFFNRKVLQQLNQKAYIREASFKTDGTLKTHYSLRIRGLSSEVTHFQIQDQQNRISYDHGPGLWQDIDFSFSDKNIVSYHFFNGEKLVARNTNEGEWGWFEVLQHARIDNNYSRPTLVGDLIQGEQRVILEMRNQPPFTASRLPEPDLLYSLNIDSMLLSERSFRSP